MLPGCFNGSGGISVCQVEVFADSIYYWVCDCVHIEGLPDDILGGVVVKLSADSPPNRADYLSAVEISGPSATPLLLEHEALHAAGYWQEFLGKARLQAWPDDWEMPWFQVGDIGASGQEGLRTELGGADALDATLDPVDLSAGREFRIIPEGKAGALEGALAELDLSGSSGGAALTLNLALPGGWHLDAWLGGTQVSSQVPQLAGDVVTIDTPTSLPPRLEYFGVSKDDHGRLLVELEFAQPVTLTPAGSPAVQAQLLRLTTTSTLDRLEAVRQNWAGVPSMGVFLFGRDYGDAPAPYPVTKDEGGASHRYALNWKLGTCWDREFNGTHSPNADYDDTHGVFGLPIGCIDDEGGVVVIAATGTITVQVTAQQDGFLDAWMDLNRNGTWADAGEQIVTGQSLTAGLLKVLYITVPPGTPAGSFISRWRFSQTGGLSYRGYGGKGEVEDHLIDWQPESPLEMDFGDAPEAGTTFEVKFHRDGARHGASALQLGPLWDSEPDGQPSVGADLDDLTGVNDEGGVVFPVGGFTPGTVQTVQVTVTGGGGILDAWFDWDHNLNWDAPEHSIAGFVIPGPGVYAVPVAVPPGILAGNRYARFRLSTAGSALTTGYAVDGEVEDHVVQVVAAPTISFNGINHEASGAAQLSVVSKRLAVSTAGGPGGLRIALGESEGWATAFTGLDNLQETNASVTFSAYGGRGTNSQDELVSRLSVQGQGGKATLTLDSGELGATRYQAFWHDGDGHLLGTHVLAVLPGGGNVPQLQLIACPEGTIKVETTVYVGGRWYIVLSCVRIVVEIDPNILETPDVQILELIPDVDPDEDINDFLIRHVQVDLPQLAGPVLLNDAVLKGGVLWNASGSSVLEVGPNSISASPVDAHQIGGLTMHSGVSDLADAGLLSWRADEQIIHVANIPLAPATRISNTILLRSTMVGYDRVAEQLYQISDTRVDLDLFQTLGDTTIILDGATVLASHFGPLGDDGLLVALPSNTDKYRLGISQPVPSAANPMLRFNVVGQVAGQPANGAALGQVQLDLGAQTMTISADFSALGANRATMELLLNGNPVGATLAVANGVVGSLPAGTEIVDFMVDAYPALTFTLRLARPATFTPVPGSAQPVDEIRFTPNASPSGTVTLTSLAITGANVDSLRIYRSEALEIHPHLRMAAIPGGLQLAWNSTPDKMYEVLRADRADAATAEWVRLAVVPGLSVTNETSYRVLFTAPPPAMQFYRLRVVEPAYVIRTTGQTSFCGDSNLLLSAPAPGQPLDGQDAR